MFYGVKNIMGFVKTHRYIGFSIDIRVIEMNSIRGYC